MQIIQELQIKNYKSIRELTLECARINVFVGEPNVGKSNILEALDLTYLSSMFNMNDKVDKADVINIKDYFRVDNVTDLFHLGDLSKPISVLNHGLTYDISLRYSSNNKAGTFELEKSDGGITSFDNNFQPINEQYFGSPVKPYRYSSNAAFHDVGNYFNLLMPPYGNNLFKVVKHNPVLRDTLGALLADYGCELNIDLVTEEISVQLRVNKGIVYTLPWKAVAETLKRYIFYLAAIEYNNASVVTLEEPEVHSFPKYISSIADKIIESSGPQFFIATHSPYLLNNLIENSRENELAVFVCGYDKDRYETTVKRLSSNELSELLDFGVDIFFNINRYADNRTKHSS